MNIKEYLSQLELCGAGEIYLSAVHKDGTFEGYDIDFYKDIVKDLRVPVIVNGGGRNIKDFAMVIQEANVSAVSAGSMFVFNGPHKAVLITYPEYNLLEQSLGALN